MINTSRDYLQKIHAQLKDMNFWLSNTTKPNELFEEIISCLEIINKNGVNNNEKTTY